MPLDVTPAPKRISLPLPQLAATPAVVVVSFCQTPSVLVMRNSFDLFLTLYSTEASAVWSSNTRADTSRPSGPRVPSHEHVASAVVTVLEPGQAEVPGVVTVSVPDGASGWHVDVPVPLVVNAYWFAAVVPGLPMTAGNPAGEMAAPDVTSAAAYCTQWLYALAPSHAFGT